MKKRFLSFIFPIILLLTILTGCVKENKSLNLSDGDYLVKFTTDSSMFHLNEACNGLAKMHVVNGQGTVEIILPSKNTVNLYSGLKKNAEKEGAVLIDPVVVSVTYEDGMVEEVNSFHVPVPVIDEEFDLALIGTKGVWYDHKVMISDPVPYTEEILEKNEEIKEETINITKDVNEIYVSLEGGTGKARLESPASVTKTDSGYVVTLTWSSPYYDYMIVDGDKYYPVNEEGNSVFEIPLKSFNDSIEVLADTTAMSEPHEIEYTIIFSNEEIVAE